MKVAALFKDQTLIRHAYNEHESPSVDGGRIQAVHHSKEA